jgi:hypothetical protein
MFVLLSPCSPPLISISQAKRVYSLIAPPLPITYNQHTHSIELPLPPSPLSQHIHRHRLTFSGQCVSRVKSICPALFCASAYASALIFFRIGHTRSAGIATPQYKALKLFHQFFCFPIAQSLLELLRSVQDMTSAFSFNHIQPR